MHEQNNRSISEFERYSPFEMQYILYDTFGEKSPINLTEVTESDYKTIPILNQARFLIELLYKQGEIKLTPKGFLPTKIVSEMYSQGFLKEELIESGISKLCKESDSITITLTRILLELSGIVKKQNGKLSLTKNGKKSLDSSHKILYLILTAFGTKFNWAFFDRYGENNIGQLGFGFTLILLSKYGKDKKIDTFYADKYFRAFPSLIKSLENPRVETVERQEAVRCYSLRSFDRFLDYFGVINIEEEKRLSSDKYISKTEIFDKLITCR